MTSPFAKLDIGGPHANVSREVGGAAGRIRHRRPSAYFFVYLPMPERPRRAGDEVIAMIFASGFWDSLVVSVRVTADGWEAHVGALFVLVVLALGAWGLDWFDHEPETGHTTGPGTATNK